MLRLGLDSFSYRSSIAEHGPQGVRWFLDRVVELGLDGCQFDPMHLDRWNEDLIREIAAFCSDHGLYLELGSGGFDYDHLARRMEIASSAGARVVRTFISGERSETSEETLREWVRIATANFARLAEVAEGLRIPLALENHEDLTSDEVAAIMDAVGSPWIRAVVDTGNGMPVRESPVDCVRRLLPYAVATHLKDWDVRLHEGKVLREGCALGRGGAMAEQVYPMLRSAHPDMPVTLEIPSIRFDGTGQSPEEEDANIVGSIEFARKMESRPR